jgi:ABC-2 type transport system ATP-binding protein
MGQRARFSAEPQALERALQALAAAGIQSLVSQPPTLEDLFLRHYSTSSPPPKPSHQAVVP